MMEKVLIFILFVIIGSGMCTAYYFLDYTDLQQQKESVEQKIQDVKKQINSFPLLEKEIEQAKLDRQRVTSEWEELKQKVNTEPRVPEFIREVKKFTEETKTELHEIRFETLGEYEEYDILPIDITISGPYHNVGRFIARMENLRLVNARAGTLKLAPYKGGSSSIQRRGRESSFSSSGSDDEKQEVQLNFKVRSYIFKGGDFAGS